MSFQIFQMLVLITTAFGAVVTRDIIYNGGEFKDYQEENETYYWNHLARNVDASCKCGIPNLSRIVGGAEVNPKRKYPWQVGLQYRGIFFCGGSIINDRWILTAAHCISDEDSCKLNPSNWLSQVKVLVGGHYLFEWLHPNKDESYIKKYEVKTWIMHPDYECKWVNYDFALLELTETIPFDHVIRPVCLPKDDSKSYAGHTGIASGWGQTSTIGFLSFVLREVELPILPNDKCGKWGTRSPEKLCAGGEKGVCNGDSGGPLSVIENGKYVQVGVASYVHPIEGCGSASYPGIFARTSKVLSWIAKTAANGMKCE